MLPRFHDNLPVILHIFSYTVAYLIMIQENTYILWMRTLISLPIILKSYHMFNAFITNYSILFKLSSFPKVSLRVYVLNENHTKRSVKRSVYIFSSMPVVLTNVYTDIPNRKKIFVKFTVNLSLFMIKMIRYNVCSY